MGEPVALVAAADRYAAEDVAELVEVAYEPLEPLMDPDESIKPDAPKLHDNLDNNVGLRIERREGTWRPPTRRQTSSSSGATACTATPAHPSRPGAASPSTTRHQELTLHCSTQIPHILKTHLSEILDFPEFKIRVIAPDVGGGFGNKLQVPPEVVALCLMAFKTRRPVKWIESRRESLMAFLHAREQTHDVEIPMSGTAPSWGSNPTRSSTPAAISTPASAARPWAPACGFPDPTWSRASTWTSTR